MYLERFSISLFAPFSCIHSSLTAETIQLAVALPSVISGYQTTRYNQTCCFSSYPNVSINYVTNAPNRSFTVVKSIIANNQNILTCLFFSFFMPDVLTGPSEQLSLSCEATYLQSFCQMPSAVGHAEPCRTASTMLAFPGKCAKKKSIIV